MLTAVRKPKVGAVSPLGQEEYYLYRWPNTKIRNRTALVELVDRGFQHWYFNRFKSVGWLSGFCLLIPKSVINRVGLFDERFFFGWEDIDYSMQLRLKGYQLMNIKPLFIYHQRSGSSSPKRHRQLVRKAKKDFVTKWSGLLKQRFGHYNEVFSEVNQLVGAQDK